MPLYRALILLTLPLFTSSCGIPTVVGSVVTAPVKIISKSADLATTSQSEKDENRGRQMREREEELGRLTRQREKYAEKCQQDRDDDACEKYTETERKLEVLGY